MKSSGAGRSRRSTVLLWGVGPFVAGVCLAAAAGTAVFTGDLLRVLQSPPVRRITATAAATPTKATATRTPAVTAAATARAPTPVSSMEADLRQAERYLATNRPEDAIAQVKAVLGQLVENRDLARAFTVLAEAEAQLGHFQLAAGYFEQVYQFAPSAEVLFQAATYYELGGDLDSALAKYLQLLSEYNDPGLAELRQMAEERAQAIVAVIGTPTAQP